MINDKQLVAMDIAWLGSNMEFKKDRKFFADLVVELLNNKITAEDAAKKINDALPFISIHDLVNIKVFNVKNGIKDLQKNLLILQINAISEKQMRNKININLVLSKKKEILRLTNCDELRKINTYARCKFGISRLSYSY